MSYGPLRDYDVEALLALKNELVVAHATVLHELLDRGIDPSGRALDIR